MPPGPGLFVGRFLFVFLITDSVSLLVISWLKLFILDSVLVGCIVSRKLSISSRLSNQIMNM